MKIRNLVLITMTGALALSAGAKSPKRGLAEGSWSFQSQMEALQPGVSWYYNWAQEPKTVRMPDKTDFYTLIEGYQFYPMCWNGNYSAEKIRNFVKAHPDCKLLLGFNEPNFANQANMTPAEAAEAWPAIQALAKELDLKLVAPVLNYGPAVSSDHKLYRWTNPDAWMNEFVRLVGRDAFDYTAIHNYGGVGVMKEFATRWHNSYGKDVLVTEWCYWPGGAGSVYVAPEKQISDMIESVEFLEKTPWIAKYAWFKAIGAYDQKNQPNYGLLTRPWTYAAPGTLSPQGWVYTYLSDFDADKWYNVDETAPARQYIASNKIMLEHTEYMDMKLDVTDLKAESYVDYQFNVSENGRYRLELAVAGYGEPDRFDPTLRIWDVTDGKEEPLTEAEKFSLPNDDEKYQAKTFEISLSAGHRTIRIAVPDNTMPSGLKMAAVTLRKAGGVAGVADGADAPVRYYSLSGVEVSADNLTNGIYIARQGNKATKFVVK